MTWVGKGSGVVFNCPFQVLGSSSPSERCKDQGGREKRRRTRRREEIDNWLILKSGKNRGHCYVVVKNTKQAYRKVLVTITS